MHQKPLIRDRRSERDSLRFATYIDFLMFIAGNRINQSILNQNNLFQQIERSKLDGIDRDQRIDSFSGLSYGLSSFRSLRDEFNFLSF